MRIAPIKQSVAHAWHGIRYVYTHEQNFRIQLVVAGGVICLAVYERLTKTEYIVLIMLIMAVLGLELINSAIERFFDVAHPRLRFHIGIAKDMLAGLVLMVSIGAVCIGSMIFWPYIIPGVERIFSF